MPRVVHIHNAHPRLKIDRRAVSKIIHTLDANAAEFPGEPRTTKPAPPPGVPAGELSLAFLTDPALARIHGDFLDDPTDTDVITFEGNLALASAGEICVSADTAATFAATHDHDFSRELSLYVIHGWLHLAGYDDLKPEKKRRMRAAEKRALALLDAANALPRFSLATQR